VYQDKGGSIMSLTQEQQDYLDDEYDRQRDDDMVAEFEAKQLKKKFKSRVLDDGRVEFYD